MGKKKLTNGEKEFVRGLFCAASFMAGTHGEKTYATDIITEAGYTLADGKACGVEDSDLALVADAFGETTP